MLTPVLSDNWDQIRIRRNFRLGRSIYTSSRAFPYNP